MIAKYDITIGKINFRFWDTVCVVYNGHIIVELPYNIEIKYDEYINSIFQLMEMGKKNFKEELVDMFKL